VPQSAIIGASYFGMDITLAHPKGLDLDPEILQAVAALAGEAGTQVVRDA